MPAIAPIRASNREPKRVRPISQKVKTACLLMIYGKPDADDDAAAPLSFVQAARTVGMEPYVLRRWLDKPAVIALIRSERALYRRALCCGNEAALARIRDHCDNAAAAVRATLALEQIEAASVIQSRGTQQTPGIVIVISPPEPTPVAVTTIEHPTRAGGDDSLLAATRP
jgi:hypothetical protein